MENVQQKASWKKSAKIEVRTGKIVGIRFASSEKPGQKQRNYEISSVIQW